MHRVAEVSLVCSEQGVAQSSKVDRGPFVLLFDTLL